MLVLASGLWLGGCATTEAEDTGEPGIAYTVGAALGQAVSGFFTGFLTGLAGLPQYGGGGTAYSPSTVYRSPTYSTTAYNQSYGHRTHHSPSSHHRHHRRHR